MAEGAVSSEDAEPGVPGQGGSTGAAGSPSRDELEARYRTLVRSRLPAAAREQGWGLRDDHCFGRVLLDDAVGGCWYDVLDRRRTAFTQLDDAQLAGAVALGEQLLEQGDPLLRELDARSLAWRGKPPKRAARGS
jgi:hypothetical protein